jgi:hypothetical protein
VNQPRPALESPDATAEICADFAKLAPLAAVIPQWCDAGHAIGKAYQAACFVLDYALPKGRGHSFVPAAYRVRCAIDAVLVKRDDPKRVNNPDATTVAMLRALWIERQTQRDVAKRAGRDLKTIQERIKRALAALTAELGHAVQHFEPGQFAYLNEQPKPIDKSFKRPKPQLRTPPAEPARPLSRTGMRRRIDRLVPRYLAKGGQIRRFSSGLTHDWAQADAALHSPDRQTDAWQGAGYSIVVPKESLAGKPAPLEPQYEQLPAMPARRLPLKGKKYKDLSRLPGATSHASEVWGFLHGAGFNDARAKEEEADKKAVHELVEQLLDPDTRKRREEEGSDDLTPEEREVERRRKNELTPEQREVERHRELEKELLRGINDVPSETGETLAAGSTRSKRRRGLTTREWLESPKVKDEIRKRKIIERDKRDRAGKSYRASEVLEEVKHHRQLPSKPPEPMRLEDLKRVDFLKQDEKVKHARRKGHTLPSRNARQKGEDSI